jgi:hypothetical protein
VDPGKTPDLAKRDAFQLICHRVYVPVGDASMYDFINVFTEHAKTLLYRQKIEVETRAGELTSWISKNKRMFI